MINELLHDPGAAVDWDRLRPLLDDVIHGLNERDREAVLLRFFEGKALAEVAAAIRLTEEGARSRVDRALDKMQAMLTQRGITSTTAALGVALGNQVGIAAPAGLASTIIQTALSSAATSGGAIVLPGFLHFMSTTKTIAGIACALAIVGIATSIHQIREVRQRDALLRTAVQQQDESRVKLLALEQQLGSAAQHARAADADTTELLMTIEHALAGMQSSKAPSRSGVLTHSAVQARYSQGLDFARQGEGAAALKEFLWCFDDGMARVSTFRVARRGALLDAMTKLGQQHPEALAAMRARRDEAEKNMLAGNFEMDSAADFVALNRALNEVDRTLMHYDQLPPGDSRRLDMAVLAFEQLVAARRYNDAARAKPYRRMEAQFESAARDRPLPAGTSNPEAIQKSKRDFAVKVAANNIEVLAGAGDLAHAQSLAKKLLAYDSSAETRAILQNQLARAGHPELLSKLLGK